MTDSTSPSGTPQNASGNPESITENKDSVAYETYRKVLGEKKKRDEELAAAKQRLEELERLQKEQEETKLKEKEDFKTLLQLREQELNESKQKLQTLETDINDGKKLNAFLKAINGTVDNHYLSLVDLDKIVIDPNTNMPDENSVMAFAKEFEQTYSKIIDRPSGQKLPNNAASFGNGSLTVEEWTKLPLKEKKARLSEVVNKH